MIPKFRVYDKENNYMFMLSECHVESNVGRLFLDLMGITHKCHPIDSGYVADKENYLFMQSTGLFDSTGVEIYLGDIVQREYEYGPASIAPIIYVPKCAKFMFNQKSEKGGWDTDVDVYKTTKLTVLGDRFQHPHLLEKSA